MGQMDRAGFAGQAFDDFYVDQALALAEDYASINEDFEAADEELFEEDLLSLIAHRPSRRTRSAAR